MSIHKNLRKNPFWPTITEQLGANGYHVFYPEQTPNGFRVVITTTSGPQHYSFKNRASSFHTALNFKAMFNRFIRDMIERGYGPPIVPEARKPGQSFKLPQNLVGQHSSPSVTSPGDETELRRPAARVGASPVPTREQVDASPTPTLTLTLTKEPEKVSTPPQTEPEPIAPAPAVQHAPKEEDMEALFALNSNDLLTVISVLSGMGRLLSAVPLSRRGPMAMPSPPKIVTVTPAPRPVERPAGGVRRNIGGLRTRDWILLRMYGARDTAWTYDDIGAVFGSLGYRPTSASPTVTSLVKDSFVRLVGQGKFVMTPAGVEFARQLVKTHGTFDEVVKRLS